MKLYDAIFCDDIRHEVNNKFSLMGIYNEEIVFHVPNKNEVGPQLFKLSLLLRFKINKEEQYPERFEFAYTLNGVNIQPSLGMMHQNNGQEIIVLGLAHQTMPLQAGDLGFSIKLFKKNTVLLNVEESCGIKIIIK